MATGDDPLGKHGVCHLLADAGRQRPKPLRREDSVAWSLAFGRFVAAAVSDLTLNPTEDLKAYLAALNVGDSSPCELPGEPCDLCIASVMLPMYAADSVMKLSRQTDADPVLVFRWASRIGSIVLSNPSTDHASNPTDAMAAFVLGEYTVSRTVYCDLAAQASV